MSQVYFNYFLGQWQLCRIDEAYVEAVVVKGRLTREEADQILVAPRNCA